MALPLVTISVRWELSASSAERRTLCQEYTSTLLLISENGFGPVMQDYSMSTDVTRMYQFLGEHHKKVTTMQSKMETLSQGDLSDQTEAEFLRELAIPGMKSWEREMSESFGNYVKSWLRELCYSALYPYNASRIGDFERIHHHTQHQGVSASTRRMWLSSISGYERTWLDMRVE